MANEQFSEALVLSEMHCVLGRNTFGSVFPQGDVPTIANVMTLLKQAGGKPANCALGDYTQGGRGKAKPEFIISFDKEPNTIIVVECKKLGRIDVYGKWENIKAQWLDLYRNRREKPGLSVLHAVTHTDEWCAEAYMETDYSKLTDEVFIRKMKDYIAFTYLNEEVK